jgi:hypothetical protein
VQPFQELPGQWRKTNPQGSDWKPEELRKRGPTSGGRRVGVVMWPPSNTLLVSHEVMEGSNKHNPQAKVQRPLHIPRQTEKGNILTHTA